MDTKNKLQADIDAIQRRIISGVVSDEEAAIKLDLLKQIKEMDKVEMGDLAQKAKVKWGVEGDENSSFFHASVNRKRRQMAIRGVMLDGDWVVDPIEVKAAFKHHFSSRFLRDEGIRPVLVTDNFKKLSADQRLFLDAPFCNDEIKQAVWDCGSDKAPGPNGFTFVFFKSYWDVVKDDVFKLVRSFQDRRVIPRGCNPSFIALIPKVYDPKFTSDFRPISLIGA